MLKQIALYLALVLVGVAIGRYTLPAKVVEKEKIIYQEKIVEKKVYVKDTEKKTDKVTIRLVTIKPDGTKTIETKIYDKSEIEITQRGTVETDKSTDISKETEKTVEYAKPSLLLSASTKVKLDDYSLVYGALLQKRVLGPFYLGGFGFLDKTIGITLGLSF